MLRGETDHFLSRNKTLDRGETKDTLRLCSQTAQQLESSHGTAARNSDLTT